MPYRSRSEVPSGTGDLITVRRYLDSTAAQLDRARLTAEGLEAHVIEAASFNPLLGGISGGTQLQVREGDLTRAEALLRHDPEDQPVDDGEGSDVVRCPRCELAYCFHERIRLEGSSAAHALAIFAAPFVALMPKRWHCHKCGHVWTNPKEGPTAMTKLEEDDPRPIFRLRRAHTGMGIFLGLMIGLFGALLATSAIEGDVGRTIALVLGVGAPLVGWAVGSTLRHDVCSEPSCRTALTSDREDCPRCLGSIAGAITTAEAHYSAAADFRRELAALHAKDQAQKKKKKRAAATA